MSAAIGAWFTGSVTGFSSVAIGISPAPPLGAEELGFEHAARIAARLGMAIAAPPARVRNCRRDMSFGWRIYPSCAGRGPYSI